MDFDTNKVKLIAEIGGNHEGDFEYANHLTDLAIESGVDSIKFQIYSGKTLVNETIDKQRKEHFDKFSLTNEQYQQLAEKCIRSNVDFNASIWNDAQIEIFDKYLTFYKVGSGDLTCFPILEKLAKRGKPMIISSGLANLKEIRDAVDVLINTNEKYKSKNMLCIMQCTSVYPCPDIELNLNVIETLKKEFDYIIGYSNHSPNLSSLEYALVKGAKILEFHFTDKREGKTFRDHSVSFTKDEVKQLRRKIQFISDSLGLSEKKPTFSEISTDHIKSFRKSIYPSRDLRENTVVEKDDFTFLRPEAGLKANQLDLILGKKTKRNLSKLEKISLEDFE